MSEIKSEKADIFIHNQSFIDGNYDNFVIYDKDAKKAVIIAEQEARERALEAHIRESTCRTSHGICLKLSEDVEYCKDNNGCYIKKRFFKNIR